MSAQIGSALRLGKRVSDDLGLDDGNEEMECGERRGASIASMLGEDRAEDGVDVFPDRREKDAVFPGIGSRE